MRPPGGHRVRGIGERLVEDSKSVGMAGGERGKRGRRRCRQGIDMVAATIGGLVFGRRRRGDDQMGERAAIAESADTGHRLRRRPRNRRRWHDGGDGGRVESRCRRAVVLVGRNHAMGKGLDELDHRGDAGGRFLMADRALHRAED